jgi:hypothetical protein
MGDFGGAHWLGRSLAVWPIAPTLGDAGANKPGTEYGHAKPSGSSSIASPSDMVTTANLLAAARVCRSLGEPTVDQREPDVWVSTCLS